MLGSESKVLMVECVELLVLRHGIVVFTRPILVIIVDVELLFKSQKKNIQADNQICQKPISAREARSESLTLLLTPLKKTNQVNFNRFNSFQSHKVIIR